MTGNTLRLTSTQEAIYYDQLLNGDASRYNIGGYMMMQGPIQEQRFRLVLADLLQAHDNFRLSFRNEAGGVQQVYLDSVPVEVPLIDMADATEQELVAWMDERFAIPFHTDQVPLFEVTLIRGPADVYYYFMKCHHLIIDGHAIGTFTFKLAMSYARSLQGRALRNRQVPTWRQFSQHDQNYLNSACFEEDQTYWAKRLSGLSGCPLRKGVASRYKVALPKQTWMKLAGLRAGVGPYKAALAGLFIFLQRLRGSRDLVVGVPVANRERAFMKTIGSFSRIMPLRMNVDPNQTLAKLLENLEKAMAQDMEHLAYPISRIAGEKRGQLFDTSFNYIKWPRDIQIEDKACTIRFLSTALFCDLSIGINEQPGRDQLEMYFEYAEDAFNHEQMKQLQQRFFHLLEQLPTGLNQPIGQLGVMLPHEQTRSLLTCNRTGRDYPLSPFTHEMFEGRVAQHPEKTALVLDSCSYLTLNQRANLLAHYLIEKGITAEQTVGLAMGRSSDLVVCLLAVMKAGATYVPLDPSYPQDRLNYMVEDAGCALLLTEQRQPWAPPNLDQVVLCQEQAAINDCASHNPNLVIWGHQLAYIIYTSGSTGKPKGVQISYGALSNFMISMCDKPGLDANDVLLATTTVCFDISALELYLPLIRGAGLVLADGQTQADATALSAMIHKHKVSVMQATPATWQMLRGSGWNGPPLKRILSGGEPLSEDLAQWLRSRCASLWNLYGPTETTIWSTRCELSDGGAVRVGVPIDNTRVYVLNDDMMALPPGDAGHLMIGGDGLARGYQGQPARTAAVFRPDPFASPRHEGSRLYHTGDLARWDTATTGLEVLGRTDQQIKLRGFRIEIGDIEAALRGLEAVADAAVCLCGTGSGKHLIAHLVPAHESLPEVTQIRQALSRQLPAYMVPARFNSVDALPMTNNGKLDRKQLLTLIQEPRSSAEVAHTPTQAKLAQEWAQVLKWEGSYKTIQPLDNFFDLGGNSLTAAELLHNINKDCGTTLTGRAIMEHLTLERMAAVIDRSASSQQEETPRYDQNWLAREAYLDPDIQPGSIQKTSPKTVLLTGATGFLGAYLLQDLLHKSPVRVVCLVRAPNAEHALERVQRNLQIRGIWRASFASRIEVVCGDLTEPRLGLDPASFADLARRVDLVLHNGAQVNFIYPYPLLRAANVEGTHELLRLAALGKPKPFHFVSTFSVFPQKKGRRVEERAVGADELPHNGYALSKLVAEHLVTQAGARGLPVSIYRPGRISGHRESGDMNIDDLVYRMVLACVQTGICPNWGGTMDLTPVDYVSQAMVQLMLGQPAVGRFYHLTHPSPVSIPSFFRFFEDAGFPMQYLPFEQWRDRIQEQVGKDPQHGMFPLLPFLNEWNPPSTAGPEVQRYAVDNVLQGLNGSGPQCPLIDTQLLYRYLAFFRREGLVVPGLT